MAGQSKTTTDHKTIQKWVEERGGFPARVKQTGSDNDAGMLRIDFPGYSGENSLQRIDWDQWFQKFDEKHLVFLYQDEMKSGAPSRFWKLISPETEHAREEEHREHSKR